MFAGRLDNFDSGSLWFKASGAWGNASAETYIMQVLLGASFGFQAQRAGSE
jgi:hypothetical protein